MMTEESPQKMVTTPDPCANFRWSHTGVIDAIRRRTEIFERVRHAI